jgi:hypothetical protein
LGADPLKNKAYAVERQKQSSKSLGDLGRKLKIWIYENFAQWFKSHPAQQLFV